MIPIYISVAGQDEQAVALLSSPQSWQICLAKHTILSSNSSTSGSTVSIVLAGADRISNMTDVVSAGRIWRADEEDIRSGFAIRAEVVIPRGTTPSFAFPYITVSVGSWVQHRIRFTNSCVALLVCTTNSPCGLWAEVAVI